LFSYVQWVIFGQMIGPIESDRKNVIDDSQLGQFNSFAEYAFIVNLA